MTVSSTFRVLWLESSLSVRSVMVPLVIGFVLFSAYYARDLVRMADVFDCGVYHAPVVSVVFGAEGSCGVSVSGSGRLCMVSGPGNLVTGFGSVFLPDSAVSCALDVAVGVVPRHRGIWYPLAIASREK